MSHPVTRLLLWALVLMALVPAARASGDPFEWVEPPPEVQLEEDRTEIPIGKGAVFVPSIVGPLTEPPVILVDERTNEVIDIPTAERVLVDPGSYVVIVSSGTPAQGVGQAIDVVEGETTLVPVRWGALRIEVTDERRVPHRGGYEIIRADTREPYGTGFGADTLQGEQLMTWLLPPGVYRIVKPGANYRALRDFATVYVPEAGFVRYRLVTDPETGEFQGAGVLLPGEFGSPRAGRQRWFSSLVLGADGSFVQQSNVVGVTNQTSLSGALFVDGQLAHNVGDHRTSLLLQAEAGGTWIQPQTAESGFDAIFTGADDSDLLFLKTRDRLRGDLLHTWYLRPSFGPYARAAAETQAFRTHVVPTTDTDFVVEGSDGGTTTVSVPANGRFEVADPFEPTIVREGAGLNTRFVNNRWVTFNLRVGFGLRQNVYAGSLVPTDDPSTPLLAEYTQVESFNQEGIESTVVATARLPGWVVYATDVELFADFQDFARPSVEWRNTLTLRLTRNLSLNYYANVDYLPQVTGLAQFEQSVLLRASWALL